MNGDWISRHQGHAQFHTAAAFNRHFVIKKWKCPGQKAGRQATHGQSLVPSSGQHAQLSSGNQTAVGRRLFCLFFFISICRLTKRSKKVRRRAEFVGPTQGKAAAVKERRQQLLQFKEPGAYGHYQPLISLFLLFLTGKVRQQQLPGCWSLDNN